MRRGAYDTVGKLGEGAMQTGAAARHVPTIRPMARLDAYATMKRILIRGRRILVALEEGAISYDTGAAPSMSDDARVFQQRIADLEAALATAQAHERAAIDALMTIQQRQHLHVEHTPLAIIEWDTMFHIVAWNPAAMRIFGYTAAEAIGQHAMLLLPPELERPIVDELWNSLKTQRGGTRSTNGNITKDARMIECEWYNMSLIDPQGTFMGVVSLVQDVTAHHTAERERAMLQAQIITNQQAALRELSTPLIPLTQDIVIMPLIGTIDSARVQHINDALLAGVADTRATTVILDITGVHMVDTQVANALVRTSQAVKLLGAPVILTGIRPEVSQMLVRLGVNLTAMVTRSTLQAGIAYAMQRAG